MSDRWVTEPSSLDPGNNRCKAKTSPRADEIHYIQNKAADHDSLIVGFRQLVLISSETGDARLLDVSNQLAVRLASDGDPQSIHLEETDTSFAFGWKGHYHIDGPACIYSNRETRVTTILGYPTQAIARAV